MAKREISLGEQAPVRYCGVRPLRGTTLSSHADGNTLGHSHRQLSFGPEHWRRITNDK